MRLRHRVRALSCLQGMMDPESNEVCWTTVRLLAVRALTPPDPEDRALCLTARETPLGAWLPRLAGLARKGGPGDLQDARTRRNPPIPLRRHGAHTFGVPK